jgi:hypothetical protein
MRVWREGWARATWLRSAVECGKRRAETHVVGVELLSKRWVGYRLAGRILSLIWIRYISYLILSLIWSVGTGGRRRKISVFLPLLPLSGAITPA